MTTPTQRVELTTSSIVKFFAVLLCVLLLWKVLDILALLFVVTIVVAALNPAVDWLVSREIPRPAAVALLYILILGIIGIPFSMFLPRLIEQVTELALTFPTIVERITPLYRLLVESNAQELLRSLSSSVSSLTQGIFSATAHIFGGATALLTVLVLSFYLLIDVKQAHDALVTVIPPHWLKPMYRMLTRTSDKLGSWLRGQFILSALMGFIVYVGLLILGVPYALTLGFLTGLLEIVPYLGAIIAGFSTVIVAYAAGSWQLALVTLIFFTVVQQLESHILVPKVMQSAVGLSPVIVIVALAVGAKLGGITGAIIAVPLAAVISVFVQEWPRLRQP